MPVISVEIMKTTDQREMQKNNKRKTKTDWRKGTQATVKGRELNNFVVHFSFLQLTCKASLIFKSNL